MSEHPRLQIADELLRRVAAAVRGSQLYSPAHPLVGRNVSALADLLAPVLDQQRAVTIGIVSGEFVVGETPLPRTSLTMGDLLKRLQRAGVERITVARGVTREEVATLVQALATAEAQASPGGASFPAMAHIDVGQLQLQQRLEAPIVDAQAVRKVYADAATEAATLWEMTKSEGKPDPAQVRGVVDTLAQAAAQNRSALMALTALKQYDNYTFTHMVNVSILTMAQARAVGIEGHLLREFGMAGLMHDVGKVRTPDEILNKPDRLTVAEFEIMKRHVVEGAEILRRTPDIPPLVPIVAFEHHLRIDGSGYPPGVRRRALNLATQLCGIADVYDAMRSSRRYQSALPTDRILAVLQRNDGTQFDQRLVRRFVQIVGIYPVGNLVRLDTGEVAVVVKANAADPYRPQVRVVMDATGRRLGRHYEVSLWEQHAGSGAPASVTAPLDPTELRLDQLALV
jgi:putative nucleotidyltransferase with HDIG domain